MTNSSSYVKVKEVISYLNLKSIRVSWEYKVDDPNTVFAKIYVNGVAVGVEKSTSSTTYVEVSDDITDIKINDLIQIYMRREPQDIAFIQNMKIKYLEFKNNDP